MHHLPGDCGRVSEEQVKQGFDDYVQALKDADGEKWCDSVASPELADSPRDEREQQIELCKDDFDDETLSEASDRLGDPEIRDITVKGDLATADVTDTINGAQQKFPVAVSQGSTATEKWRFGSR